MAHKTSTKARPTPLKDLQIAVQADQSRRYLILDPDSTLPSPAYPFDSPLQQDNPAWQLPLDYLSPSPLAQVETRVDALQYRWNDSLDSHTHDDLDRHYRSSTPPISPPALSPRGQDTMYSSKRSGGTFALVPAQVHRKHVFTHVVVNPQDNDSKQDPSPPSVSPRENGLPEDMQDILRQLDDLASWVKAAPSYKDCNPSSIVHATHLPGHPGTDAGGHSTGNLSDGLFPSKGKSRLLSTSKCGDCRDLVDSSRGAIPGNPTKMSPAIDCQSEGFIYMPDCNTPEFLVGSSRSPVAYPVCGYSSHPSHYSPHPPETTHDIPHHRRFLERRSAPCPPPTSPFVSPPAGKTSFRSLFQRSRCNTTAVARPSIPPGHVPVESALRQGKKTRLPWLRI